MELDSNLDELDEEGDDQEIEGGGEATLTGEEEGYGYEAPMHQELQKSDTDESENNFDDEYSDNGLDDGLGPEDGEDIVEDPEGDWGYAEL
ncbi:hypothetical protein H2248_004204 [Termitomyces sp. 'cryptogamus']|nr:hypothetical protein H2248_004204 [Termitomyces sp. 'cryptogamus']